MKKSVVDVYVEMVNKSIALKKSKDAQTKAIAMELGFWASQFEKTEEINPRTYFRYKDKG